MEPAFDQSSIANTLRRAIENGRFTLEDLDRPALASEERQPDRRTFPNGYEAFSTATSCEATQAPHSRTEAPRKRPNIYPDPIRIRIPTPLSDERP